MRPCLSLLVKALMQLFVNQLTNVDFSFLDAQRGLVGETWLASALLDGQQDEEGMICDFGLVKKVLRQWLDDELDHRLAVPTLAPNLELTLKDDRVQLRWQLADQQVIEMDAPRQAVALVNASEISAESVAAWCKTQLQPLFPVNVAQLQLSFVPENISGAQYHYSHGLKKHSGNCQRIAHGHRSRLHIWLDGQAAPELEAQWANLWNDRYLGLEADLVQQHEQHAYFRYQASQGEFHLTLPQHICYMLPMDTTVENLAEYLAEQIKAAHPQAQVKVQAFEGINKGAIVER